MKGGIATRTQIGGNYLGGKVYVAIKSENVASAKLLMIRYSAVCFVSTQILRQNNKNAPMSNRDFLG